MGTPTDPRLRVGIIGAGRMGRALARAAAAAGWDVATYGRGEQPARGLDVAFVTVPDDALATVVAGLDATWSAASGSAPLVVVASGAVSIDALGAAAPNVRLARIHPMQTVSLESPVGVLDGIVAAVTARGADRGRAHAIATALGMVPFDLRDEDAPAWHAAAVFAAGHLTTLLAAAQQLAMHAGLDEAAARRAVTTLARGAVDRVHDEGPASAMTGPIVRGDVETVELHLRAIGVQAPGLVEPYRSLAGLGVAIAADEGRIDHVQRTRIEAALQEEESWA